jgi:hypothetical protein
MLLFSLDTLTLCPHCHSFQLFIKTAHVGEKVPLDAAVAGSYSGRVSDSI